MKKLLTALMVLVFASALFASVQVPDGLYTSTSAGGSGTGEVFSANGGNQLGFINTAGGSARFEWVEPTGPYRKLGAPGSPRPTAEFVQAIDGDGEPIPGLYTWRAYDSNGNLLDSGTLSVV